jgi:hypothetical protein
MASDVIILADRGTGPQNISPTTVTVNIRRGRTDETESFQTGTAQITLRNLDGQYDPTADPFQLRDPIAIYLGTDVADTWAAQPDLWANMPSTWFGRPVFTGFVEDVELDYDLSGDAIVQLRCVDGLALLANQTLIDTAVAEEQSGERVQAVLANDGVSWPAGTAIDTGISQLAAGTATGNALQYLRAVEESEQGYLFVSTNGTLTFRSRNTILNEPLGTDTFTDDGTGIPYEQIVRFSGARSLFNRVTGSLEDGTERSADDVASQAQFSIRTLDLGTVLLRAVAVLEDFLDYLLFRFRTPATRVDSLTVNLAALSPEDAFRVAGIELVEAVDVTFTPPGRSAFTDAGLVQGISHSVTVGGPWRVTFSFEPRDVRSFLTLDDAEAGKLDQNVLAF